MKFGKFYSLMFLLLLLSAASCRKASSVTLGCPEEEQSSPIIFAVDQSLDIETTTKAEAVTFLSSFYVSATTGASSETEKWSSALFSASDISYFGDKYWPITDPKYHFYASNIKLDFSSKGCTVSPSSADTDVVCAYLANPVYKQNNELSFHHIYARIGTLTLNAPSGCTLYDVTWSISAPQTGTYDIKTDTWTPGQEVDIQMQPGVSSVNNIYLLPGTYELTCNYTIQKGDYIEAQTRKGTVELPQGKISDITGTAIDGSTEISYSVIVLNWNYSNITVTW